MRYFALLLLLALGAPAPAGEVLLREARAWRGTVEARALGKAPGGGEGREEQIERVELLLATEPPRRPGAARLRFRPREMDGRYEVRIRHRDGGVTTKGETEGRLRPRVDGHIDTGAGRYRLEVNVTPARFVVKTTMSGMEKGRFQTFRTVAPRNALLADFVAQGELPADGRTIEGSRTFTDRKEKYPREVTLTWRLERIDPVVQGRVVDHLGQPLAGLAVVATMTSAERVRNRLPPLRREGVTGTDGGFAIDVFLAHWNVEVAGTVRGTEVVAGKEVEGGTEVRFEEAPFLEIEVPIYRLEALPYRKLLRDHFEGDVKSYLAYIRERVSDTRLRKARIQ